MKTFYQLTPHTSNYDTDLIIGGDFLLPNGEHADSLFWEGGEVNQTSFPVIKLAIDWHPHVSQHGQISDLLNTNGNIIISKKVAKIFSTLRTENIQLFPLEFENLPEQYSVLKEYQLLNVIDVLSCIDLNNSKLAIDEDDGEIMKVYDLVLTSSSIPVSSSIFRVKDWELALIFDFKLYSTFIQEGVTGCAFKPVSVV